MKVHLPNTLQETAAHTCTNEGKDGYIHKGIPIKGVSFEINGILIELEYIFQSATKICDMYRFTMYVKEGNKFFVRTSTLGSIPQTLKTLKSFEISGNILSVAQVTELSEFIKLYFILNPRE